MNTWIGQRQLRRQGDFAAVREYLSAWYLLDPGPRVRVTRYFFDTFDWRLYHRNRVLEFDAAPRSVARLRRVDGPGPCTKAAVDRVFPFAADWSSGPLRRALSADCAERALLERAACSLQVAPYAIVDDDGKIRGWLEHEQVRDGRRTVARFVRVSALRGYAKSGRRLLQRIDGFLGPSTLADDLYTDCLRRSDLEPGAYSTRLAAALSPDMRSDDALAGVLLFLLGIMELNLDGVIRDLDSEFLHDFRIACRRSRTLLTQVRGVFPAPQLSRFKREFAWLSRCTGAQRDLDVMLLDFPEFQDMVPASMRSELAPLQSLLQERRAAAHAGLRKQLKSQRFRTFVRHWRRFLLRRGARRKTGVAGTRPVAETAEISLRRVARKLAKEGKNAGSGGYSEQLHDLRKTGKKLRYLLEAFRSLYPGREVERVVSRLRKLQNTLGEIVDRHVQSTCLLAWAEELREGGVTDETQLTTIRRVAQVCAHRQAAAEPKFEARFERYLEAARSSILNGASSSRK